MSRKTLTVEIKEGRDAGKVFLITEMPARAAHRWATRALFALMNGGIEIPDDIAEKGMAGIAAIGVQSLGNIPFEAAEPLLDEMLQCVEIIPNPDKPEVHRRPVDEDYEDFTTLFKLQKEALGLHLDFFTADGQ